MKIFIGADHNGVNLAKEIEKELQKEGYEVEYSKLPSSPQDDYPDFAFEIGEKVASTPNSYGILLCGNGIGISIAANKVKNIRCARITSIEDAHHAKCHNDANIIAFGGISKDFALQLIKTFLKTPSINEERHIRRVNKIIEYERGA